MENRLKEFRMKSHMTLGNLATRSQVPACTVNNIEHGAEPRFSVALRLADTLGVSVFEIFPIQLPKNTKK